MSEYIKCSNVILTLCNYNGSNFLVIGNIPNWSIGVISLALSTLTIMVASFL